MKRDPEECLQPQEEEPESEEEYLIRKKKERREAFIESTAAYRESYDQEGKFCPRRF